MDLPPTQADQLESRWTTVNGYLMHARVGEDQAPPDAPSIVLVHGLAVSSRYMVPLAVALTPHFRVYALDLPGFGKSDKPSRSLRLSELADALGAWLRATGLRHPVLFGNSFGCQIIVELAARPHEDVREVVLAGPTGDPQQNVIKLVGRWLADLPREPLSLGLVILRDSIDCGLGRAFFTLRESLRDRMPEKLPQVQAHVLVVRGARDPIAPQRWVETLTDLLPQGQLVVVPGTAHTLNYADPHLLTPLVLEFMKGER